MSYTREILSENDRSHLQPYGEKITVSWTADSGGGHSEVITSLRGFLVKLRTGPGSSAPTAYGLQLFETTVGEQLTTVDELNGITSGSNTRSATVQEKLPVAGSGVTLLTYMNGDYTFTISGAGNGGQGICEFYLKNR